MSVEEAFKLAVTANLGFKPQGKRMDEMTDPRPTYALNQANSCFK